MRLPMRFVAVVGACVVAPSVLVACLWDYDTIKMERSRFPDTLELITGKFLRHSPEFYQWRIENRLKRLEADPRNLALLDDLAAAYDKTGQHEKAIEVARRSLDMAPDRYETLANLGTFYFHAGKLRDGLPHIEWALKINPDAHFGREKYQKLLVEYVLSRSDGGPLKLPLTRRELSGPSKPHFESDMFSTYSFADFLHPDRGHRGLSLEESSAAVKGILGMMKFGKHDAPVLLEALGSLLTQGEMSTQTDAKLLAARAYLKASYEVPEGPSRVAYRELAKSALSMQTVSRDNGGQISLGQVERDFAKELAEANQWYAELRERELGLIRDGKNPEAEFDKLYDADPQVSGMDANDPGRPTYSWLLPWVIAAGIVAVLVLVGVLLVSCDFFRQAWRRADPSQRAG